MFQSTHPHGVRRFAGLGSAEIASFNPRTHTGCDDREKKLTDPIVVSIHAPTRGATRGTCHLANNLASFNPRTHTGCDMVLCKAVENSTLFQSTHPHGVRQR